MGCGTGGHALPLSQRGYSVCGVDRSPEMTGIAQAKAEAQGLKVRFQNGDIRDIHLGEIFDAAICMFAVLGYQTTNEGLFATLRSVRRHLKNKGIFICDFWYGPAVLQDRPEERAKTIHEGEDRIIRIARPAIDTRTDVVTVSYQILRLRGLQLVEETQEVHEMRYLFRPELDFFMAQAGMKLVHFCPFMKVDSQAAEDTWNVTAVAQAI